MSDRSLEQLFWEEFDGPPSADRREQIETLLRERPAARRELEELQELATALQDAEEVTPPPELGVALRRALENRPGHTAKTEPALLSWLRPMAAGWRPRLAYATAGVLIGVFGYHLITGGPSSLAEPDRSKLVGTLNPGSAARPEPTEMTLAGSAGALRLSRDGGNLFAALIPTPDQSLELTLRREDGDLELLRVEEIGAAWHAIDTRRGVVRVTADGPVSLVLEATEGGSPAIDVRVATSAGATVFERQMELVQLAAGD